MSPPLKIVLFIQPKQTRTALRGAITRHFEANLKSVFSVPFLRMCLRALEPDVCLLDRQAQKSAVQKGGLLPSSEDDLLWRPHWILLGLGTPWLHVPSERTFCLEENPRLRDVVSALELSAAERGVTDSRGRDGEDLRDPRDRPL